jgi:dUTP pyrophosphatase
MDCKIKKLRPDAIIPQKAHMHDTGYDLWILGVHKELDSGVTLYSTGLAIDPPLGCYFEVIPRSSISKTGYIQANSVGVIDNGYRGELLIPLYKINPDLPDIEFPKKIAQLVLRELNTVEFVEVDKLSETPRGTGSYGSTDKKGFKTQSRDSWRQPLNVDNLPWK